MTPSDAIEASEAAAICGMTLDGWRAAALRNRRGRMHPPMPRPIGIAEDKPGRPNLYARAEVEAWAKVRRRRSRI